MAAAGVFVLKHDRTLVAMQSTEFARESDFQALVGDFPELLAGEQMNAQSPRRFLLVAREQSVPSEAESEGRWFLDHLFVDQDAVPTLVEVKRQSDVRLRREVIGQLMEYAANAVAFWPPETLRESFEARCRLQELDAEGELTRHLVTGANIDGFWKIAGENLRAGRVRLVLVADLIPPELRRIVEFMNGQMQPAEVLAVELRQFQGEGLKALAPLVIGQTIETASQKRSSRSAFAWSVESILEALSAQPAAQEAARAIMSWIEAKGIAPQVTQGGAMGPAIKHAGARLYPFLITRHGELTFFFDYVSDRPIYAVRERREAWAKDLSAAGLPIAPREVDGRQLVPLATFTPAMTVAFLEAMDKFLARLPSETNSGN